MIRKITWALFGNDEDGIYGTRKWQIDNWGLDLPPYWFVAIFWWLRNPFHNLFWHVLNWPNDKASNIWEDGNFIKFRLIPPLISFRKGLEGYIGFRGHQGVFGVALRIKNARSA